jgi:hypothetical protein
LVGGFSKSFYGSQTEAKLEHYPLLSRLRNPTQHPPSSPAPASASDAGGRRPARMSAAYDSETPSVAARRCDPRDFPHPRFDLTGTGKVGSKQWRGCILREKFSYTPRLTDSDPGHGARSRARGGRVGARVRQLDQLMLKTQVSRLVCLRPCICTSRGNTWCNGLELRFAEPNCA